MLQTGSFFADDHFGLQSVVSFAVGYWYFGLFVAVAVGSFSVFYMIDEVGGG